MRSDNENVVKKLFPDPFQKNQTSACLWINNLKLCAVCFIVYHVEGYQVYRGISIKYIEEHISTKND